MKTIPQNAPDFFPQGPGERLDSYLLGPLAYLLAALLIAAVLWSFITLPDETLATSPQPRLELLLSGVLTSSLTFSADELSAVECSPTGFSVQSTENSPLSTPIALTLSGLRGETGSYQILGSNSQLTLTVAGARYTLVSGTVSSTPEGRIFNASLVDAQSQPLQLSGRFSCPYSRYHLGSYTLTQGNGV